MVKLTDGNTIKVVENDKEFDDVPESYWGYEAVQFGSSCELFTDTGDSVFSPDATITRAMVWTVLARLDGTRHRGGNLVCRRSAVGNEISDGTNPNGMVIREQMAAMLYRYAQMKDYDTEGKADLSDYIDAEKIL